MTGLSDLYQAKINPKYLHSNSTSHTWLFSAIAELIDNAYDPDVSASELWIDQEMIAGKCCLVFTDNGSGMDLNTLCKMMSFGYCEKAQYEDSGGSGNARLPIGQYGNGFKSGSMRLAKDALVFTVRRQSQTACVGFLSQTMCLDGNQDTLVLPLLEYTLPDLARSSNPELKMDVSLKAILEFSPYTSEDELKEVLRKILGQRSRSGTTIVLLRLKRNKNGVLELDFESDPDDIRNPETHEDSQESIHQQVKVFEYRQSLRRYCSILFKKPKMKIFIRKKRVKDFLINGVLLKRQTLSYKPKGKEKGAEIVFGYLPRKGAEAMEDFGIMFYHRNRLIKPYVKIGCQNRSGEKAGGARVVGVVDVTYVLQPTHNKQEFNVDADYISTMKSLATKLDTYCGQRVILDEERDEDYRWTWVGCDRCSKWRRVPAFADSKKLPEKWYCHMNPDQSKNRCDIPEEKPADEEYDIFPSSPERCQTPGRKRGGSSSGRGRGRGRGRLSSPSLAPLSIGASQEVSTVQGFTPTTPIASPLSAPAQMTDQPSLSPSSVSPLPPSTPVQQVPDVNVAPPSPPKRASSEPDRMDSEKRLRIVGRQSIHNIADRLAIKQEPKEGEGQWNPGPRTEREKNVARVAPNPPSLELVKLEKVDDAAALDALSVSLPAFNKAGNTSRMAVRRNLAESGQGFRSAQPSPAVPGSSVSRNNNSGLDTISGNLSTTTPATVTSSAIASLTNTNNDTFNDSFRNATTTATDTTNNNNNAALATTTSNNSGDVAPPQTLVEERFERFKGDVDRLLNFLVSKRILQVPVSISPGKGEENVQKLMDYFCISSEDL